MKYWLFPAAMAVLALVCPQTGVSGENPPPRVAPADPCQLATQIGLAVNHDLITLQPANGYWVEYGLSEWEEMRAGMPEEQAARFDSTFMNLDQAYRFVLDAAQTWAFASQTRMAVSADVMLAMKYNFRSSLGRARLLLMRASRACQAHP
jgi:hypothetical protein